MAMEESEQLQDLEVLLIAIYFKQWRLSDVISPLQVCTRKRKEIADPSGRICIGN